MSITRNDFNKIIGEIKSNNDYIVTFRSRLEVNTFNSSTKETRQSISMSSRPA